MEAHWEAAESEMMGGLDLKPSKVLGGGEDLSTEHIDHAKGPDTQVGVRQPCLCYSGNSSCEKNHQTENKYSTIQKEENILSKESQLECVSTGNRQFKYILSCT